VFTLEGNTARQVLKADKKVKARRAAELDFEEAEIGWIGGGSEMKASAET
jgi:hypothetical protein